jgi:hypothetical protein
LKRRKNTGLAVIKAMEEVTPLCRKGGPMELGPKEKSQLEEDVDDLFMSPPTNDDTDEEDEDEEDEDDVDEDVDEEEEEP